MKPKWVNVVAAALGLLGVQARAQDQAALDVGVTSDPCASVPQPPPFVRERIAARKDPSKQNAPVPELSPEQAAAFKQWQDQQRLADYPDLCRYEAANATLPPATAHRIVFLGDSITDAWSGARPEFFKGDRVNRGISGQTTGQMLGRFQADVVALRPETVHILAGTNDLAGNSGATTIARIANNIRSMVDLARVNHIRVIIGTVLPVARYGWRPEIDSVPAVKTLNQWIRSFAREQNIELVDYYAAMDDGRSGLSTDDSRDGVHPTATGYAKMEAALGTALR